MSAPTVGPVGFWSSVFAVFRRPLIVQPFVIVGHVLNCTGHSLFTLLVALLWGLIAGAGWLGRLLTVVAGEAAFVGGILLCLVGLGHIGAPISVVGFVAARLAA